MLCYAALRCLVLRCHVSLCCVVLCVVLWFDSETIAKQCERFSVSFLGHPFACLPLQVVVVIVVVVGDTAAPGRNPEVEVAIRALKAEIEVAKGNSWTQMMWDIEAFYDSMEIPQTIERLELKGAPRTSTALALVARKARLRWPRQELRF